MKKLIFIFLLIITYPADAANINIELQNAKLTEVLNLFMKGVFKSEYILSNEVKSDNQEITVSLKNKTPDQAKSIFIRLCKEHDLAFENQDGIYYISKNKKRQNAEIEQPPSVKTVQAEILPNPPTFKLEPDKDPILVPEGENVDLSDLTEKLAKAQNLTVYDPLQTSPENLQKLLTFAGIKSEILNGKVLFDLPDSKADFVRNLIADFDKNKPDLVIKASLYEYTKTNNKQSAIEAVFNIIKNVATATLPTVNIASSGSITLTQPDITATFKALNSSENFKVLSTPTLRATDDKQSSITIGASVPILNSILTNPNGQAQQSIVYRDSGIILQVTPKIRRENIELNIMQSVSDFTQTTTGVNTSPTLFQRKLETTLNCKDGDLILLGGLEEQKNQTGRGTFLGIPTSNKATQANTDLLLVLHVTKI